VRRSEPVHSFTHWLAGTPLSVLFAQTSWLVPATQTIHIVAIALLFSAVLMVTLHIVGMIAPRQSLAATVARFRAWFWGALVMLAATGAILIITEPPRELTAVSFWLKMTALAIGIAIAIAFLRSIDRDPARWEITRQGTPHQVAARRTLGLITLLVWCVVVFLGRFIAYDEQIWGGLSGPH
jgi:hypothetical protein